MLSPIRDRSGVSLIEVLVVIALIATILSFSSHVMSIYRQSAINKVRDDVLSVVEKARSLSIVSLPHGIVCSNNRIILIGLKDGRCDEGNNSCYDNTDCSESRCEYGDYLKMSDENDYRELEVHSLPSGYSICCDDSCKEYVIWFDRKGIPRENENWDPYSKRIAVELNFNKDGKSYKMTSISISPTGRIQYEK